MRYDYKEYDHSLCPITRAETHEYPKSEVKVGNIILPIDGSWSLVVKRGRLVGESIAYEPQRKPWKVLATEGRFPTAGFESPLQNHIILPGDKRPSGRNLEWNDIMICRLHDGAVGFTHSTQVRVIETI